MIQAVIAFITAIPSIVGGVTAFTNKFYDTKRDMAVARIGGDVNVARQIVIAAAQSEATGVDRLKVIAGSKGLLFLTIAFSLPYIIYEWQCIVYDKVWMHGLTKTDPLGGDLSAWATTIIASLFGSSTVLAAGHMYFNRNKTGE